MTEEHATLLSVLGRVFVLGCVLATAIAFLWPSNPRRALRRLTVRWHRAVRAIAGLTPRERVFMLRTGMIAFGTGGVLGFVVALMWLRIWP